jgi:1-acyl-sn-glycerol-3-phosphate acyltransferase
MIMNSTPPSAMGRPKPFAFRPPKNNSFFIAFVKYALLPFLLRFNTKISKVEIEKEDLQRLQTLKGQRVVLTPNHSEGNEPYVLFYLSRILGEEFNFLAAKEVFECYSPAGRLLQSLGVYSLVRGRPDRKSFHTTHTLLLEGKHWLVIFPEGGSASLGDMVMPFQPAIARIAFWAHEDLSRRENAPPVYLVPVVMKTVYLQDMRPAITLALGRLENKLKLPVTCGKTPIERLRSIGETVVAANEKTYNVQPRKGSTLNERIQNLKMLIASRVASALNIPERPDQKISERIRDLFNAIDRIRCTDPGGHEYGLMLRKNRRKEVDILYDDLMRVFNFMTFDTGYIKEKPTVERFLDVLGLVELEVNGRRRFWGPRKAVIKVGLPVNLGDYALTYRTHKQEVLSGINGLLESSVQTMLQELASLSHPMD